MTGYEPIISPIDTTLTELQISSCSLWSIRVKSIANALTTIHSLDVSNNNIGNDGATILAGVLKHNNRLCNLIITTNLIDTDGATSLVDALLTCTNLQTLDISNNLLTTEEIEVLQQSLKHCTTLKF